jgi:hypothetical protein
MSTAIQDQMQEMNSIVNELKIVNARAKELRERKKTLEKAILDWLVVNDRPGCMFKELIVLRKEATTHSRMKKKEKQERILTVLEDNGINDADKLLESINKAMTGDEQTETKLSFKIAGI